MELVRNDACLRCGRGHGFGVGLTPECTNCESAPEDWPFEMVISAGDYRGRLRDAVLAAKFGRRLGLLEPLGTWLASAIEARGASVDLVVPVPMGWLGRMIRGFNQSELLARVVARRLGVPCVSRALRRRGYRPPQRGLSESGRRKNPKGSFSPGRQRHRVSGHRVLVVDDVLTTGATMREARRVLMRMGAKGVLVGVAATTSTGGMARPA